MLRKMKMFAVVLAVALAAIAVPAQATLLTFGGDQSTTEHPLTPADYAGQLPAGVTMTSNWKACNGTGSHVYSTPGSAVYETSGATESTYVAYFQFSSTIEIPSMWIMKYQENSVGSSYARGLLGGVEQWVSQEIEREPNFTWREVTSGAGITIDRLEVSNFRVAVDDITVIPEPATMALLAFGACLPLLRRRRR